MTIALGESLNPHQRALSTENGENRQQQELPMRIDDASASPANWQQHEKTDQIVSRSKCGGGGLGGQG